MVLGAQGLLSLEWGARLPRISPRNVTKIAFGERSCVMAAIAVFEAVIAVNTDEAAVAVFSALIAVATILAAIAVSI